MIQRKTGYNNSEMADYCERLLNIVTKPKYKKEDRVIKEIKESIDYYKPSFSFREYQLDIIKRGTEILFSNGFLYLAMEVRTGKTLTSLGIAERIGAKTVLFITKKKAIGSIEDDYEDLSPQFKMTVINYESLHKVDHSAGWDLVVLDEAHSLGAFPKPNQRAMIDRKSVV